MRKSKPRKVANRAPLTTGRRIQPCPNPHSRMKVGDKCACGFVAGPFPEDVVTNVRLHMGAPPHGASTNQTEGFHSVLLRLYRIEDAVTPVTRETQATFAEARAICERFLPESLVKMLRSKYG